MTTPDPTPAEPGAEASPRTLEGFGTGGGAAGEDDVAGSLPAAAREPAPAAALLRDVLVVVGLCLLVGALLGLLWPHLVTPVEVTKTDQGISTGEVDLSLRFDNDAWFAILGGLAGLVLGAALTVWRHTREMVTLLALVAGSFAAVWLMARVGHAVGPADPVSVLRNSPTGTTAPDMISVTSTGAYYMWPIGAVLGAFVVLVGFPGRSDSRHGTAADDAGTATADETTASTDEASGPATPGAPPPE